MTQPLSHKVSHIEAGFFTKVQASMADHPFVRFVSKLEKWFDK
jgi:hypothetical protein